MKLSAKTEYACLAMLELAGQQSGGATVCAGEIAERHGIPPQFLVQILRTLRDAGLVESSRGSQGGYRLSVSPHETTLAEIVYAMEGRPNPEATRRPAAPSSPCCDALQSAIEEATSAYRAVLEETTLAALVDASRAAEAAMYYI